MRGKTVRSNRLVIRKLGLLVCAASIVGTLAGVARSQSTDGVLCFFNVTNTSGDVGSCVQGAVNCLQNCIYGSCRATRSTLKALCVQGCVNEFSFAQGSCIGKFSNTTIP